MPTIGSYVVDKIDGTMNEERRQKWAWDRPNLGAACVMYIPSRDLKMIGPFQGWPKGKDQCQG